ncbi:HEAT repeat domain-containing protein [Actinomadura algeriensis]|uniref:HEAT repeat protein n=1 Tax=Actinomadura algeriensis TaxID=1679523 RepID=A0ABR9JQA8_9ACTN|nr:SMI1/KNR4 family protein [Actinomadura algeriensis]MBE1532752.1 HEAT repeat protein [Actinomadura algeriensis]
MDERLRRIAAKLAIVPHLTHRSHSFGEETHRFALGPPLPEDDVARFEARIGAELPRPYRDFLTTIGHGGAGPYYGLEPLDGRDPVRGCPSRAFPLAPGPRPGPDWHLDVPGEPYDGTIPLASQGCTYWSVLVVTGPARGRVLDIDESLQPPFFTSDPDFLAWYERWLDELAAGLESRGFSMSLAGTQAAVAELLRGDPDPIVRVRAARTLARYPVRSPRTLAVLAAALRLDPEPDVRAAALRAMPVPDFALDDPSPVVRVAAVTRLARTDARAVRMVRDPDPAVRVEVLLRSDLLTEGDVLHLLNDTAAPVRAYVLPVLRRLGSPHAVPSARAALDDPDPGVRSSAFGNLRRARALTPDEHAELLADSDERLRARAERTPPPDGRLQHGP